MDIGAVYFYYLPREWKLEFRTQLDRIQGLDKSNIWESSENRCPIPSIIAYLQKEPDYSTIEMIRDGKYSLNPDQRQTYLQIKNDAPSFWTSIRRSIHTPTTDWGYLKRHFQLHYRLRIFQNVTSSFRFIKIESGRLDLNEI